MAVREGHDTTAAPKSSGLCASSLAGGKAGAIGLSSHRGLDERRADHESDLRWRFQDADGAMSHLPSVQAAIERTLTMGFVDHSHTDTDSITQYQLDAIRRARTIDTILASLPRSPNPLARILASAYGDVRAGTFTRLVLPYEGIIARHTRSVRAAFSLVEKAGRPRTCAEYVEHLCELVARRKASLDEEELMLTARNEALGLRDAALGFYMTRAEAMGRRERRMWA